MRHARTRRRFAAALASAVVAALLTAAAASAHARVLPAQALAGGTPFTLSVPNEKEDATTNKVVLTVPEGFNIGLIADSTAGSASSRRPAAARTSGCQGHLDVDRRGDGRGSAVRVHRPQRPGSYTFQVEQSYSDGSVVDWAGPPDADEPAPVVQMEESFGGGGGSSNSTLAIVALVIGAIALVVGGLALARAGGRQLA